MTNDTDATANRQPLSDSSEPDWQALRARNLEESKARLRKQVENGFYPITQLSGRPCVAVGEPI